MVVVGASSDHLLGQRLGFGSAFRGCRAVPSLILCQVRHVVHMHPRQPCDAACLEGVRGAVLGGIQVLELRGGLGTCRVKIRCEPGALQP